MKICLKCGGNFPNSIVIDGKRRVFNNRKFCLKCSPYGKHNTSNLLVKMRLERFCPKCEKLLNIKEFYSRRTNDYSSYCAQCTVSTNREKQINFKKTCIDYKGGCCGKCGYDRYIGALEFHHREKKDFSVSSRKVWGEYVIKELDKCDLLCVNCHREEHIRELSSTRHVEHGNRPSKICPKCCLELPEGYFYKGVCKGCANRESGEKSRLLKQKSVEYLGGCCVNCGYKKYVGALEFHHIDPNSKDVKLSSSRRGFDKIKRELDKCKLLCGNCHREEHARIKGTLQLQENVVALERAAQGQAPDKTGIASLSPDRTFGSVISKEDSNGSNVGRGSSNLS